MRVCVCVDVLERGKERGEREGVIMTEMREREGEKKKERNVEKLERK